jgi:hypothetical protein
MNGPEHYLRAEALLARAADYQGEPSADHALMAAAAQAHATLALAAATAMQSYRANEEAIFGMGDGDFHAWSVATRK